MRRRLPADALAKSLVQMAPIGDNDLVLPAGCSHSLDATDVLPLFCLG